MTVLMIACSRQAYGLMQRLAKELKEQQPEMEIVSKVKCKSLPEYSEKGSLTECVGTWFEKADGIVFLCAAGIAVRSIAPYIRHKSTDPAVVVVDEKGKFSIALLSGHTGGANELAGRIADILGAVPVITTATDREGKFAVDDFARKNKMTILDWKLAKQISVEILEGKKVGIVSELPLEGKLPEDLFLWEGDLENNQNFLIRISTYKLPCMQQGRVLQLIPKTVVVGIGCRKGTAKEKIASAVGECLGEEDILPEAVFSVASIDLKKEEKGLLAYCEEKGVPLVTYSAEQLKQAEGEFSVSAFVEEITGVSCVCERSAVMAAKGDLLCHKKIYDGVTVALAYRKGIVRF